MANLTMLVIVVSLSSFLFVWAISSFGAYQGGAGYWFSSKSLANQERISVENVFFTGTTNNVAKIYVRNVGPIPFTIGSVYVNSTLYNIAPLTVNVTQVIPVPGACGLTFVSGQQWRSGNVQTIKIATLRGTVVTTTWVA
jgi:hypothetical protein